LPGQRGRVGLVIANRLNVPLFKARVKALQHSIVGNRALLCMEKSIRTRKPECANGTAAAVIDRTTTGNVSRNPRSPPFRMNDQKVSPSI
jgi:hypothetical protein